jgi:thioredoxin 1
MLDIKDTILPAQTDGGSQMGTHTKSVTDSSFENDVLKSDTPVLVDFWAEWCGPCKAIGPRLEEIAGEYSGKVVVAKVNVDENPGAPAKYGVRGIPTLIMFKSGKEVEQLVGAHPKDKIVDLIKKHL